MKKLSCFVCILLFILLPACKFTNGYEAVVVKNLYSISYPEYMGPETERTLNPEASLQFLNFYRNIYSVVIDKEKTEGSTLNDFYAHHLKVLLPNLRSPQQIDSTQVTINGLKGVSVSITGDSGPKEIEERLFYRLVFLESETHYYHIAIWAWDKYRDKFLQDLDLIQNSFKEVKK